MLIAKLWSPTGSNSLRLNVSQISPDGSFLVPKRNQKLRITLFFFVEYDETVITTFCMKDLLLAGGNRSILRRTKQWLSSQYKIDSCGESKMVFGVQTYNDFIAGTVVFCKCHNSQNITDWIGN